MKRSGDWFVTDSELRKVIQADLSKPIKCDFIHGRRARYTNF